ncbi:MAG: hypothetical protein OEZ59_08955 [Deltaproteobacteria bacterium]|nr:hypothetical protein [Deltaproteobacteria bacterium]
MKIKTINCEECLEDIPSSEIHLEDGRLYCGRCGSEVESPDKDLFEEISDNHSSYRFRSEDEDMVDDVDFDDDEDDELDDDDGDDEDFSVEDEEEY